MINTVLITVFKNKKTLAFTKTYYLVTVIYLHFA